jgi:ELWxxDGT repeat protein
MLPTAAVAQTPVMLDLNPYSATTADSTPQNFAVLGSRVVFAASDNANGTELWITDGTTAGTQLLLDINTGTASSSPQNLTTFGSRVVFTATTVANGRELWITDGTAAGTTLVRDIRTGATGSTFSSAFGVVGTFGTPGSYISFGANDGVSGTEPWVTDGTNAGTIFLRDIAAGSTSSNASGFFAAPNGKVYFLANEGTSGILTGNELHATDGTPAGTVRVTDYAPGTASSGMSLDVAVGNFGFGPATLAATGQEPVAFDLTTNAVIALGDILPGSSSSLPQEFVAVGTEVFFRATTTGSDIRLYRVTYDGLGTPNGFAPVVDINTTGNDNVGNLAVMGGEVYFAATDGTSGRELWKSNGTIAGTVRVADINAGPGDSTPLGLIAVGSKVFFSATTPAGGREQYVTDGTAAGTFRLADLRLGQANGLAATPGQIGFGSGLLFAGSGTSIGLELFGTDGTVAGTALVKDIRPQTGNSASAPTSLVASGGRVYFSATDEGNGRELWSSDGTPAGTAVVLDTFPGVSGGTPSNGAPYGITPFLGGVLYASNNGTGAGQTGIEYYRATGGPGLPTAAIIANINPTTGSSAPGTINNIGVLNDVAYFSATDGVTGAELWKYDGISAPQQVQDLAPGSTSSFPANFAVLGNELYFQAGFIIAGGSGLELYRSNGSTITLVEDFNPGTTASSPAALFPFNGRLFMRATSPSIGVELVCYDPTLTTPDMYLVQDIRTGSSSSTPSNFLDFNGQLLFTATDALGNTQLYTATEATNSVTVKSTAIGSTATTLVKSGGYAYFAAGNLIGTNVELYAYSGTGNAFPIELNATAGSFPTNLTDVNGRLYFAAVGNSGGNELYRVVLNGSGVPTGAELVADLNSTGSSDPRNFRVLGNKLFFAANDGVNGEELWLLSTIVACTQSDVAGPGPTVGADGELTADDIIQFISWFTANNPLADIASPGPVAGADGELTADDIILFITRFTAGC